MSDKSVLPLPPPTPPCPRQVFPPSRHRGAVEVVWTRVECCVGTR
ncbi:hypothetical protein E2C01_102608 [Portunus trituberculatus]|uniref:Uncharacterized protein n=1 Tax=Portunus trituberculatus TaxID=210409 RepID=A0A5B7KHR1_PORTR|nr:hypothetical protein [Portunus trituberculatus]